MHGVAGAALVRRLEADERTRRLVLLDRRAPALPLRRIRRFTAIDLTATLADVALAEIFARERVDTVIHAAFHERPRRDLEAAHELEVLGTRALFRAIADNVAPRRDDRQRRRARHDDELRSASRQRRSTSAEDAPLRGGVGYPFVADKVAVEREADVLRARTGLPVAMMRLAPTVGDERTLMAQLLAPSAVPAVIGTDPLMQLLDLDDLVEAVRTAAHGRLDGAFNVAGEEVLPLSTVIKLAGDCARALPEAALRLALQSMWVVGAGLVPRCARLVSPRHLRRGHHAHGRGPRLSDAAMGSATRWRATSAPSRSARGARREPSGARDAAELRCCARERVL